MAIPEVSPTCSDCAAMAPAARCRPYARYQVQPARHLRRRGGRQVGLTLCLPPAVLLRRCRCNCSALRLPQSVGSVAPSATSWRSV
eukprot:9168837-Heterocapsa_arctica.AAC.1